MRHTDQTFVQLLTKNVSDFSESCGAACLFYWGDHAENGLRIEAPSIAKQFVDNVHFGRDPEGVLFYSNVADLDFDSGAQVTYTVTKNSESPPAIIVDFFPPAVQGPNRFCSFLTRDTSKFSDTLLGKFENSGSGTWKTFEFATSFARAHKLSIDPVVNLRLAPIGKQVQFDLVNNGVHVHWENKDHSISASGNFYYYKSGDIRAGTVAEVHMDEDSIKFVDKTTKALLGMFFPVRGIKARVDMRPNWPVPIATFTDI